MRVHHPREIRPFGGGKKLIPACGAGSEMRRSSSGATMTNTRREVTCKACRKTPAWKAEPGEEPTDSLGGPWRFRIDDKNRIVEIFSHPENHIRIPREIFDELARRVEDHDFRHDPLRVNCPQCGMGVNQGCLTRGGFECKPHAKRETRLNQKLKHIRLEKG